MGDNGRRSSWWRSDNPALPALEGLFVALPLFLVIFESAYYLMSRAGASNFTEPLCRTDALYFTMTTFSTVAPGIRPRRGPPSRQPTPTVVRYGLAAQ